MCRFRALWTQLSVNHSSSIHNRVECEHIFLSAKTGQGTKGLPFLAVNNFFVCVFKKIDQKNMCASTVFKAESEQKH